MTVVKVGFTVTANMNPYMTNGLSHRYHLDEPTFTFRVIQFFDEFSPSKQNSPRWDAAFWGYILCLCPTKRTTGLDELKQSTQRVWLHVLIFYHCCYLLSCKVVSVTVYDGHYYL